MTIWGLTPVQLIWFAFIASLLGNIGFVIGVVLHALIR